MNRRILLVALGGIGLIIVGAIGWYLGSPLFIDRTVEEALPFEIPNMEELEAMPEADREAMGEKIMATAAAMPDKAMEESMPSEGEPTAVLQGAFVGADSFHQGSGSATIFELPDGGRVLRLEDFSVTNGPDLHVFLAEGAAPTSQDDLGEHLDLGELKGNIGNQNYEIPAGVDLSRYGSVVIYCVPFHVVFSTATLS